MQMISKFEALGIAFSIAAMALVLFLLQHDPTLVAKTVPTEQTAAVVVVDKDSSTDTKALETALVQSYGNEGLQKLVVDDVTIGTGREAVVGSKVTVNYIGRLENGQEFDNSYNKGKPFSFTLGKKEVIAGWEQGIVGMKVGGKRVLVIPASLAYGDKNIGPIPAGSTLLFSIELLAVE